MACLGVQHVWGCDAHVPEVLRCLVGATCRGALLRHRLQGEKGGCAHVRGLLIIFIYQGCMCGGGAVSDRRGSEAVSLALL